MWFRDPVGDWLHIQIADDAPSHLPVAPDFNYGGRIRRIGERAVGLDQMTSPKRARPRRLGHLIKFTPDVARSVEFYTSVLGLKLSDGAHGRLAFLRCGGGGDHHILGFGKSSHSGLHHLSFEVGDFDELMIGGQTMVQAGYRNSFGPGRHIPGSNYFHYVRDPWNGLAEYYWDMDFIPEDDSGYVPYDFKGPPEEWIAAWTASPPDPDFLVNMEEPD
jgi:catechol 2,3-dioxygenase-like lactoylglutathione lyase family enzyme